MSNKLAQTIVFICVFAFAIFLMTIPALISARTPAPVETEPSVIVETEPEPTTISTEPETEPTLSPEEVLCQARAEEYPVATRMWLHMKTFGWSDEVCAGIIGNVMAETGARTLDIPLKEYKGGPFGLIQWTKSRREKVVALYGYDATAEEQLDFVYDELYGTDGIEQQVKDYERERILNADTAQKAAKYFCKDFERPKGKGTIRQKYAQIAYEYFTSD